MKDLSTLEDEIEAALFCQYRMVRNKRTPTNLYAYQFPAVSF